MAGRVAIIGGGYAGLACAIGLARNNRTGRDPEFHVHLISPGPAFLKLAYLHRTIHTNPAEIVVPYAEVAARFGITHHDARVPLEDQELQHLARQGTLEVPGGPLEFDTLVLALGARPIPLPIDPGEEGRVLTLDWFIQNDGRQFMADFAAGAPVAEGADPQPEPRQVTVVGGGPTGIQFLFELYDFFRLRKARVRMRLVSADERLLVGFPERFHRSVAESMQDRGIELRLGTRYLGAGRGTVRTASGPDFAREETMVSDLTLLFAGVRPEPPYNADVHGRVFDGDGVALENVFAAGDCAPFEGSGLNALSAQAAVRKGKLVADNISRLAAGKRLARYNYRELGYFMSLGYWDGIGWLALRGNILTGLPAFAAKEAIEQQFNLYLGGLDTYVNPFALL